MFLPLVDLLRCPRPHEDTWLVASIDRADDRDILEGRLGCPICHAEFEIHDGVVQFDADAPRAARIAPSEESAVRLAATLGLTDAKMTAVLQGEWGAHAAIIRGLSPAGLLLVNPPLGVTSGDGVSIICAMTAPLARGSVHAAAFDAGASETMRASLVTALRPAGRLLGPATAALPAGFVELARDDEVWVAAAPVSGVESAPVTLERRQR